MAATPSKEESNGLPMDQPPWFTQVLERISNIDTNVSKLHKRIEGISESIDFTIKTVEDACSKVEQSEKKISELESENSTLKQNVNMLQKRVSYLECQSKRDNLIFDGVPETNNETWEKTEEIISKLLQEKLGLKESDYELERVHRSGQKKADKPRIIVAKFHSFKQRSLVWSKRSKLQGSNIWLNEDFPPHIKKNRDKLMPIYLSARRCEEVKNVSLTLDQLRINGKLFTVENLNELPDQLDLKKTSTIQTENAVVFSSKYSILSNLHIMDVMLDGRIYNSNEQYIQYSKAMLFKDLDTADLILKEQDSYKQMELGKTVKGYRKHIWEANAPRILNRVNREKYAQNQAAKEFLLQTENRKLGEATKHPLFGIGHSINTNNARNPALWEGQNLMGHTLEEIRNHLR